MVLPRAENSHPHLCALSYDPTTAPSFAKNGDGGLFFRPWITSMPIKGEIASNSNGIQVSGSSGKTMLSGIPFLAVTHAGSQRLHFSHIHLNQV
jgi:hypothetical protein